MSAVQELSGTTLEGYQLDGCLGFSSHTAVYRAHRGGDVWAIKIVDGELAPDGALASRLRREADVLAQVGSPSILPIHDAGRSGKLTYAVSPLVRAPTLHDLMSGGRLSSELAWRVLSSVGEALDKAHRRGLVWRLLKPGHVLMDDGKVYLAEFGVASDRVGQLALSAPTYQVSAAQYLAPEQVEGKDPDWRADIYALAVLVFEILTGTALQESKSPQEALRATLDGGPPSAAWRQPDLPSGIDQVLGRAMARDPDLRQRTAGELLAQLVTLPDDQPLLLAPRPVTAPPPRAVALVVGPQHALAPQKVPTPETSMVAVLKRMGVPVLRAQRDVLLNDYFAALVRYARQVCGQRWPEVAAAAGLEAYLWAGPPEDGERAASVASVSSLAGAIEMVFEQGSLEVLRQWGRLTTDFWTHKTQRLQEGEVTYMKPIRLWTTAARRVEDVLDVFTRNLDRIRGERLAAWKKIDKRQFWVVHYDNLAAVGRRRPGKSCHMWTAALEQTLRWGGAANNWIVDEAECGCVTGTYDCVFTIRYVDL